jgi:hypothetical protein
MTAEDQMPDRLGPYRLLGQIGEGGMGVVYMARDASGQTVALKVLRSVAAEEPMARRRLAREVETMQRVRSPYVAEVIDADLAGDMPYIVTRYVPGRTLEQVVIESGPLPPPTLARLACGLADALAAVHAAGVVHRDLKPSNVMLLDELPVVIDFGIAQGPDATRLTLTGMFMGRDGRLRRHRPPAVRVRRLRGDLLPHRERAARPHRGTGVPAAAADRRPGQGPRTPPASGAAQRPGRRARARGVRPGRGPGRRRAGEPVHRGPGDQRRPGSRRPAGGRRRTGRPRRPQRPRRGAGAPPGGHPAAAGDPPGTRRLRRRAAAGAVRARPGPAARPRPAGRVRPEAGA